jgi:hypothetical protein
MSVRRSLTYLPRFVRHYRHRRKGGYAIGHALQSTRKRMLDPTPN